MGYYSAPLFMEIPPARPYLPRTEDHARSLPPPLRYRQAPRMMYHTPGDIIICPRVRAAEENTREPAAAYSWSESDLLCWGPRNRPGGRVCRNGRKLARAVRRTSYKASQESAVPSPESFGLKSVDEVHAYHLNQSFSATLDVCGLGADRTHLLGKTGRLRPSSCLPNRSGGYSGVLGAFADCRTGDLHRGNRLELWRLIHHSDLACGCSSQAFWVR